MPKSNKYSISVCGTTFVKFSSKFSGKNKVGLCLLQKNHEISFWRFRRTKIQRIQLFWIFLLKIWWSPLKICFKDFRWTFTFGRSSKCERSLNIPFVDFHLKLDCLFETMVLWKWQIRNVIWYCWYTTVNFVTNEKYSKWGKKFHELVTESIEFYEPLRYCFAIKSFSSFVVHISNIFNSFFSLRRYLRSFVKSVVKWNMENIADIVHGRDRLLT